MTKTMHKEVGRKWVAALRSGEYKQGQRRLTKVTRGGDKQYCCLGVLCDLAVKEEGVDVTAVKNYANDISYDTSTAYLPPSVTEWAGLAGGNVVVNFNGSRTTLADLNDVGRLSFEQIADVIEENFDLAPEPEPDLPDLPRLPEDGYLPLVVGESVMVGSGPLLSTTLKVLAVTDEMVRLEGEFNVSDVLRSQIHTVMRDKEES